MTLAVRAGGLAVVLFAAVGCTPAVSQQAPDSAVASPGVDEPTAAPTQTPVALPLRQPVRQPVVAAGRPASEVEPERPRQARLPGGAVVPIRAVGTRADGELDVPDDIDLAGWWRGGSKIGDPFGSTLLAAHVDSRTQGLGAYAELLRAEPGGRIVLSSATLRQRFAVRSLQVVPQGPISDRPAVFSPAGPRRLVLVTCAPPFDAARGGYQNIVIVTADPVSGAERKAG